MGNATAVRDEPVLPRPRIVRWFADRPRIADVLVILACTAPSGAALILAPPAHAWLGWLCAAGVTAALWWRRSHPMVVLVIVVALATLNPISGNGTSPAFFESAFALYTLASRARLPVALLGYVICEAVIFGVSGLTMLLGFRADWPAVLFQPVSLLALAIGVAVRASGSRRAAIEQLVALREDRAAAAERARITAEMHDVVAHSVTVMVALAGGAAVGWEKHPERARNALDQLGTVGARTLDEMQRILRVLREQDGDLDRSLESSGHNVPSLQELVDVFRTAGLPVHLTVDPAFDAADPAADPDAGADPMLRTTVYRIVQEALTNALRHAPGATVVDVEVIRRGDRLTVTVTDNGRGGVPRPSVGAGLGLRAMRERAAAFHGTFEAGPLPTNDAGPGTGWRIRVALPVDSPSEGSAA